MNVKWISHRGESADAPENTLAAFKLSLERKTDGMECDVHLTKDQVVVTSHDYNTARMGDLVKVIDQSTFAELAEVNVSGSKINFPKERIPTFASTFQFLGKYREYYVELKPGCPALVSAVQKVLEDSGIPCRQIVIISFDKELLALSKKFMPEIRTLWLTGFSREGKRPYPNADELISILREIHADGVDALCDENVIDAEYVRKVRDAGFLFAVWTIDHPGQARRFIEMGVDSITSNCAAALRDILPPQ